MEKRYRVFTGRSSKDTEERLAEVPRSRQGGIPDPYFIPISPTGRLYEGQSMRYALFDHSHPTAVVEEAYPQPPVEGEIRFRSPNALVYWNGTGWVVLAPSPSNDPPQPTGVQSAGTAVEYSRSDHSHPTAILPEEDTQTPVEGEIRFRSPSSLVYWDGSSWVVLGGGGANPSDDPPQPTGVQSAGTATTYSRSDHSHPTALLPETDPQPPVANEIRFSVADKLVRWDGSGWVEVSVEPQPQPSDDPPQPTGVRSAGTADEYSRSDHSHPTVILPQTHSQPPVVNEIRFNSNHKLVRWTGAGWISLSVEPVPPPSDNPPEPTGSQSAGTATMYSRSDHSHPTAVLFQSSPQTPVYNEIRVNSNNKLVRWDGSTWLEVSVEPQPQPSNTAPLPVGGNPSAGTANEYSRSDHTHPIVLEQDTNLSSPQHRQLGCWASFDGIGHLVFAIRNANESRWEVPFGRPAPVLTSAVPSGRGFHGSTHTELVVRGYGSPSPRGALYYRIPASNNFHPLTVILPTATGGLEIGQLTRTATFGGTDGLWFLQGEQGGGNIRALPLSIRTYTQSAKPSASNLPTNLSDAYGIFVSDRRLIELYPQTSTGIDRPVILTSYHLDFPLRPFFLYQGGANTIIETQIYGIPAIAFTGSTSNTNLPEAITLMRFLPHGVRKVIVYLVLRNDSSFSHTFRVKVALYGHNTNTSAWFAGNGDISFTVPASSTVLVATPVMTGTVPNVADSLGGIPIALGIQRRWDLETANSITLYVGGAGLIAVRE